MERFENRREGKEFVFKRQTNHESICPRSEAKVNSSTIAKITKGDENESAQGLSLYHSRLMLLQQHSHPIWDESQLLHFQSRYLLMHLAKQQRIGQVLGDPEEAPGSLNKPRPLPPIGSLSLSVCLTFFSPLSIILLFK